MKSLFCCLIASALVATTVAEERKEEKTSVNTSNEVAVIKTSEGEMVVQFWTDAAPNTIENFKKLARQGFYDRTIFHRIVKEFMIQGGDPNSKDPAKENSYGQGGPGYQIKAEFNDHPHDRGVISMARRSGFGRLAILHLSRTGAPARSSIHDFRQVNQRRGCARKNRQHAGRAKCTRRTEQADKARRDRERKGRAG